MERRNSWLMRAALHSLRVVAAQTSLNFNFLSFDACSGGVMQQAPLKRTHQTALNFQPQKKIRTAEPDPEPMEAPKPVRPANAQPVRKLVIKNLKGNI